DAILITPDRTGGMETYAVELMTALAAEAPRDELTAFVQPALRERLAPALPSLRFVDAPPAAERPLERFFVLRGWLPEAARRAGVELLHHTANDACARRGFRSVLTLA